jgi:hypothetical protein
MSHCPPISLTHELKIGAAAFFGGCSAVSLLYYGKYGHGEAAPSASVVGVSRKGKEEARAHFVAAATKYILAGDCQRLRDVLTTSHTSFSFAFDNLTSSEWTAVLKATVFARKDVSRDVVRLLIEEFPEVFTSIPLLAWVDNMDTACPAVLAACFTNGAVLGKLMEESGRIQSREKSFAHTIVSSTQFRAVLQKVVEDDDADTLVKWLDVFRCDAKSKQLTAAVFSSFGVCEFLKECIRRRSHKVFVAVLEAALGLRDTRERSLLGLDLELRARLSDLVQEAVRCGNADALAWLVCSVPHRDVRELQLGFEDWWGGSDLGMSGFFALVLAVNRLPLVPCEARTRPAPVRRALQLLLEYNSHKVRTAAAHMLKWGAGRLEPGVQALLAYPQCRTDPGAVAMLNRLRKSKEFARTTLKRTEGHVVRKPVDMHHWLKSCTSDSRLGWRASQENSRHAALSVLSLALACAPGFSSLDVRFVFRMMPNRWWCAGLKLEDLEETVTNSICLFGLARARLEVEHDCGMGHWCSERVHDMAEAKLENTLQVLFECVESSHGSKGLVRVVQAAFVAACSSGCVDVVKRLWWNFKADLTPVLRTAYVASALLGVPHEVETSAADHVEHGHVSSTRARATTTFLLSCLDTL